MNPRARRIIATAIDLAEKGGFEAVRLRDVASEADVALGTLYRYFRSKEDLLIAALTSEVEQLEARMQARPTPGATPHDRVNAFFRAATRGLMRRPRLSRAILRAAASGDHELAEKVASFHERMSAMILAAMHGQTAAPPPDTQPADDEGDDGAPAAHDKAGNDKRSRNGDFGDADKRSGNGAAAPPTPATDEERAVAALLQHIWFSCLVGWAGGLMVQNQVIDQMNTATSLLMRAAQDA